MIPQSNHSTFSAIEYGKHALLRTRGGLETLQQSLFPSDHTPLHFALPTANAETRLHKQHGKFTRLKIPLVALGQHAPSQQTSKFQQYRWLHNVQTAIRQCQSLTRHYLDSMQTPPSLMMDDYSDSPEVALHLIEHVRSDFGQALEGVHEGLQDAISQVHENAEALDWRKMNMYHALQTYKQTTNHLMTTQDAWSKLNTTGTDERDKYLALSMKERVQHFDELGKRLENISDNLMGITSDLQYMQYYSQVKRELHHCISAIEYEIKEMNSHYSRASDTLTQSPQFPAFIKAFDELIRQSDVAQGLYETFTKSMESRYLRELANNLGNDSNPDNSLKR